ncbi:MAG: TonB-dependent receptor [Bacteroidales bacterium]
MQRKLWLCASTLFMSLSVFAQPDTLLIDQYDLDEVTISANKEAEKSALVPASLTNVSSYQFQQHHFQKLNDLTALVPNLYMPDYGTQLTSPIYIRGIGSRIGDPAVGLYVDGVPYYDKGTFDFQLLNIKQVEVLRGPQGTLYGRNTMGGLIHIITQEPSSRPQTQFEAEYGNFNTHKYVIAHNQPIRENLSGKITAQYQTRDGYFTNNFTHSGADATTSYQGEVKLNWKKEKSVFRTAIKHHHSENEGFAYKKIGVGEQTSGVAYDFPSGYNRDLTTASVNWQYSLGEGTLTSLTSAQHIKDQHKVDQDFTVQDLFRVEQDREQWLASQELRYQLQRSKWSFTSGVYGFYQDLNKTVHVIYGADAQAAYHTPEGYNKRKNYQDQNASAAAFSQFTMYQLLNALDITVGLRYDTEYSKMDYVAENRVLDNTLNKQDTLPSQWFHQWLPKITIKFPFGNKGNAYASIAKGYKSGGFNSTFEEQAHISYNAEHSWNYEMGMRKEWLQKKVTTNLALFFIDWDNQQIYQPVPSGMGSMITNAGKSQSYGFELEVTTLPIQNLLVHGALGYTKATFVDYETNPKTGDNLNGNFLPYIPRFTANGGGQYRMLLKNNWIHSVTLACQYAHTGKQYWTEENSMKQTDYGVLNAKLSADIKDITFSLWAKNITETQYQAFYFEALNNQYTQTGIPRLIGFTLSYKGAL